MSRYKHYLDIDVVEAARERIAHTYDTFDSVMVGFSGGKDSLCVLTLCHEEAEKRGRLPLDVLYRDGEFVPSTQTDFVDHFRRLPWIRMRWINPVRDGTMFILGKQIHYKWWDPERGPDRWCRPKCEWSEDVVEGSDAEQDIEATSHLKGKIALMNGIRAQESVTRYRSVVNKLNENYINVPLGLTASSPLRMVKPIYDWQETDVFKFLGENEIGWCPAYDAQHLTDGTPRRLSTPLHPQTAKLVDGVREWDPWLYQRIMDIFPEMDLQSRYWREFDKTKLVDEYIAEGWQGCERYIRERLAPDKRAEAYRLMDMYRGLARKKVRMLDGSVAEYGPERFLREALVTGSTTMRHGGFKPAKKGGGSWTPSTE